MLSLRYCLFYIALFLCINVIGQTGVNGKTYKEVLLKNRIGKDFIYDKSKGEISDKTWLRYLGSVTTKSGKTYKILTSIWVWGFSKRGTTRILIFNHKNRYVGKYVLGMTYEAPTKLIGNKLVFEYPEISGCENNLKREISFNNGIPKKFFVECKNGMGDLFYFDSSD